MKSKMNIKSIVMMAAVGIISLFFINMSLAVSTAKVNVETANLRETADENAKILELLSMNEEVEVIEKTGDWYQVKAKGITGYLRQDLISVKEEKKESNEVSKNETIEQPKEVANEVKTEEKEIELGKQNVTEDTKLKIVPVINATDLVEVKKGEAVEVIEVINGWACIETQTTKGWIRKEKLQKEEIKQEESKEEPKQEEPEKIVQEPVVVSKTLYVNSTSINLRKEANTSAEIVANLPVNTAVEVISEANGWSQVKVSGKEGYILSSLLSAQKQETSRSTTTPRTEEKPKETKKETQPVPAGKGSTTVETARQYIGCKYVYGGSTPSGFDCSGFTSYVYKQHGVTLNRTAAGQYSNGVAVDRSNLQPGDLVMFGKSGINHVGIYVGGGMMVHAANPSRGVTTDTINAGYYNNNYVGARRVM